MSDVSLTPRRPYLVVVRAGDNSLHPRWLESPVGAERTWDLLVNYYGDDPDKYRDADCTRIDSKGPKWPALYDLLMQLKDVLPHYRYLWLPDDDLECSCESITRLFAYCEQKGFLLAQPSLTPDSYLSHLLCLHNPMFHYRFTSFVELMAPCLQQDALLTLLPTFNENLSGWGLDSLWPHLLGDKGVAIIDDIQIRHTRPVGAANYGALAAKGTTAWGEMLAFMEKYNIKIRIYRVWSGQRSNGTYVSNRFWVTLVVLWGALKVAPRIAHWKTSYFVRTLLSFTRQQVLGWR